MRLRLHKYVQITQLCVAIGFMDVTWKNLPWLQGRIIAMVLKESLERTKNTTPTVPAFLPGDVVDHILRTCFLQLAALA